MSFEVLKPGLLSLLQDGGRFGHQHQAIGHGGPMDEQAFLWANRLLDNPPTAAAIEITVGQLRLRVHTATRIALTGADMGAQLNDHPIAPWCSHAVAPGDVLQLATARVGLRAYLAVTGGFTVEEQYGSCATVSREGLGGLHRDGAPLRSGDILPCPAGDPPLPRCVTPQFIPDYAEPLTLRVLPGYQFEQFSAAQRESFFNTEYRIRPDSDRMGYRLEGPTIRWEHGDILSEGISFGAIQIPPDGQPIVLLRDRQTIGGYPKLGCVAALDCAPLAQRAPGATLRFQPGNLAEIAAERSTFEQHFGLDHSG